MLIARSKDLKLVGLSFVIAMINSDSKVMYCVNIYTFSLSKYEIRCYNMVINMVATHHAYNRIGLKSSRHCRCS